ILYGIERLRKKETGPAVVASLAANFCNSGFVGMSVIMNIMPGNQSALTAAGVFMVACNGIFIAGQMMVIGWSRVKRMGNHHLHVSVPLYKRVWRFLEHFILSNAFLMATLLGLLVSVSGVPVWAPLDKGIAMLGYTAPATMIFTLGLCLRPNLVAALRAHSISVPQQIWLCSFRLVIVPALTLGVLLLLGVDPLWTCVTVVISATGTGIIVSALAQLYNAIPGPAALTIGLTNILSLFSITGTLYFLHATGLMPAGVAF
ncbi:MAG: AEC family transporter, partial [Desulfovibrionaceae bacterium]|nr:AEC family transporter [Desulfovibrionaceae bacterium]